MNQGYMNDEHNRHIGFVLPTTTTTTTNELSSQQDDCTNQLKQFIREELDKLTNHKHSTVYVYQYIPNVNIPQRKTDRSAGVDLCSSEYKTIPARSRASVLTGLKIILPDQCYGRIAPRSGLALGDGIDVGAGVVDQDYHGPVIVLLFNHSDKDFVIRVGDRIAQLIIQHIFYSEFVPLDKKEFDILTKSTEERTSRNNQIIRGEKGFGSTGINDTDAASVVKKHLEN